MPLRPACPGTEIARAPHSRRARDLRGVGSPEGSGLFGRRPAARKEAGAAPAVSRCMGQQGAVARGGGLGRPPSRSARQAERARGPGGSRQAEEDICAYCGAGGADPLRHTLPTGINSGRGIFFFGADAPTKLVSDPDRRPKQPRPARPAAGRKSLVGGTVKDDSAARQRHSTERSRRPVAQSAQHATRVPRPDKRHARGTAVRGWGARG